MIRAEREKLSRATGVTLIELLAVMLIAGLLAAITVPSFNAIMKGTALNTAATSLTNTLALARQFAIVNRVRCHAQLVRMATAQQAAREVKDNSYRVYYLDAKNKEVIVRGWRLLPKFVEFDEKKAPPDEIIFDPTGGARELPSGSWPRSFIVVHEGTKGNLKMMTVKVDGFTGRSKADAGDKTSEVD